MYRDCSANEKQKLEGVLYKLLLRHALAVTYSVLGHADQSLARRIVARVFMVQESFKGRSAFHTWFHRVAINACKMWLRKKQYRNEVELGEEAEASRTVCPHPENTVLVEQITKLLKTEQERQLLQMKMEEFTEDEIAEKLNLTRGVVSSKWTRLRKRLQRQLLSGID
jgi:RNA polymerase sigma-70 factor (ECF subfamily)